MKKSTPKTTSKKPAPKDAKSRVKAPTKKVAVKETVTRKKTVTPKRPTPKKNPVTAKTAIAAKKSATPKPPVKKSLTKKVAVKRSPAAPAPTKLSAKKVTAKSTAKPTKLDLHKTIASLESRMKQADTLTRKSVKALESSVMALDARTRKDSSTGKAALTRKVNQLSAKLTDMVAKTQTQVSAELKTALKDPSVENIQAALSRADQRMSEAEQAQATAISKVNHHLSAIATAVDARIEDEAKSRKAAITALQDQIQNDQNTLTSRMDIIEADTAKALSRVGDKIANLSSELTQRGTSSELSIREKVSEIALQTQTEFETYRAGLERRIDDVAQAPRSADTQHLEHTIATLTTRLESLEFTVANQPAVNQPAAELAMPTPMVSPTAPQLSLVPSQASPLQVMPLVAAPQAPAHESQLPDAFSPISRIPETSPAAAISNPYLTGHAETEPLLMEEPMETPEGHHPVEFDPRRFAAKAAEPQLPPPPAPDAEPLRDFTQTQAAPTAPTAPELSTLPPIPTDGKTIPYADPAYAETDPTMAGLRIGDGTDPKFNLPKLSGRNLRVAALATGVAVVGLIAAKGVFGNETTPTTPSKTVQQNVPQSIAPVSIPTPDTSTATIGDYADNKAVEVEPSSLAAKTLNSAAAAGDSIAQFQLGLSYLEQGRTDEGVALIRKSANQNQPAAQYRLAKLYEIGEGVSQDQEMARQLTERAATSGNRIAMHDLALYYAEGRGGVEPNLPTAAKWFEKAAERGVVDSQFNLGVLFESGQGLPENITDAFVWYSIAAEQGDQFAKTRIGVLKTTMKESDLVNAAKRIKQFTPRNIDEAANGIFRNVAWGNKPNENKDEKVSQVKQVQSMLEELGYDIGGADGSVGPKTRAAIMNFERVNSLPETGRVNSALTDRLELATGA